MTVAEQNEPWSFREVLVFLLVSVAGLCALSIGAGLVANQYDLAHQIPPLNLAVGGLLLGAVADAGLLFTAWRRLKERTARVCTDASGAP